MPHTSTHTYSILEISDRAYAEIKEKLTAAGYAHAFHYELDKNGEQSERIDMHGIAVAPGGNAPESEASL